MMFFNLFSQGTQDLYPVFLETQQRGARDSTRVRVPDRYFLASYNGPFQAKLAEAPGNSYSYALALVAGVVAIGVAITIRFSPEKRGVVMTVADPAPAPA